jgi:hypothetical protein
MARNVPLAEAKAEARQLDADARAHPHHCAECKPRQPCAELRQMRTELATRCRDVQTWFGPGPGQEGLWPAS